jgi:hypothetical protein
MLRSTAQRNGFVNVVLLKRRITISSPHPSGAIESVGRGCHGDKYKGITGEGTCLTRSDFFTLPGRQTGLPLPGARRKRQLIWCLWSGVVDQEWYILPAHVMISITSENKSMPILPQPSMPNILLRGSLLLKRRHSLINSLSIREKRVIRRHSGWDRLPGS